MKIYSLADFSFMDAAKETIEFVSYDGSYPCYCMGTLTLKINGETRKFGRKQPEKAFWSTSGRFFFDEDGYERVEEGPWIIDRDKLPVDLLSCMEEIEKLFNANVAPGCCGGCL